MPALITHHIFGEDVVGALPAGMVDTEEELLAFLLGNQGPDPLFARATTLPATARACRRLAGKIQGEHTTRAFMAVRDGVSHLPVPDERVGRAFSFGLLAHFALDCTAHPFVIGQVRALAEADPTLAPARREVHALIESDLDSWILWEKRRATVRERPAASNLMRTERVERVAGALFSQMALSVYGIAIGAREYAGCVRDYELVYRAVDPAGSVHARALGAAERLAHGRSFAQALAHYVRRDGECPAANLERRAWRDPFTGAVRHESFADLFDEATLLYPRLAEAFARGDEKLLRALVAGRNYGGRPGMDA